MEQILTNRATFYTFLKEKQNLRILIIGLLVCIYEFSIFKYYYPFANYIHGDSFSYITAAQENLSVNTYMVGYSKFIRLFSVFFKSDFPLVLFQYLFLQGSAIFLLYTIFFFYHIRTVIQYLLLAFIVINPLTLHLGNLISSDCIFAGLSIFWFTTLIWLAQRPSRKILIWHALFLFLSFTFRYNALFYPILSLIVVGLKLNPMRLKFAGFLFCTIPCISFVLFTGYQYKQLTGQWQYSPFSGWQLSNNAMYSYRYVDSADRKPVLAKYKLLDSMIRNYYDNTRDTKKYYTESIKASTFYMWSKGMPLFKYRDNIVFKGDTISGELKKWASMGPFYKEYGIYIIKKYPGHFFKNFILPNAEKYFSPPVEFLYFYNNNKKTITKDAAKWFNYKSIDVYTKFKDPKTVMLNYFPILSGIINVIMLFGLVIFVILKGFKTTGKFKFFILLSSAFWIINALFTIVASPAALRFQSFPIIITTVSSLLLLDLIIQIAFTKTNTNKSVNEINLNPITYA